MIKGLRRRFVIINMTLVALVLLGVFTTVCLVNYQQRVSDVETTLDRRAQIDGLEGTGEVRIPADFDGPDEGAPNRFNRRNAADDQVVATSVYIVNTEGTITNIVEDPLDLDDETEVQAVAAALQAYAEAGNESVQGRIPALNVYYRVVSIPAGERVVFASGNYIDQNMLDLTVTLAAVGLAALLAFLAISIFLAGRAVRPVEEAWRQQQQFIADASHELKTPLTVIMANNSILMGEPQSTIGRQMQWIESTESEAHTMQGLVNDMLLLATPENARNQQIYTQVNFTDLVESSILQFESVAFERGVTIDGRVQKDVSITGDEPRLQRLVTILLDNACKYGSGQEAAVTVVLKQTGSRVELTVNNTGTPIDPDDLPHVFDRFYRSDKARTRGEGGFGLGLAIARDTAQRHKGDITVASTASEGTTFTVTLPV